MKIIDICAYFVNKPVSGGQVRVFGFNQAMSKHASIEQFSYTPVLMWKKTFVYNKNYREHIHNHLFYTKGVVLLKILGIRNYDFLVPFIFKFIRAPEKLRDALKKCDIVQVEHPWLLNWISRYTDKPIILVAHNVEYDMQKDFFGSGWGKHLADSIKKNEGRAVRKANLVFAMSEEDKKRLSKLYGIKQNKIVVVPNGTRIKDFEIKLSKQGARKRLGLGRYRSYRNIALFVGATHPPNKEAADFIEKRLAPKMPDVLFLIVGNVCKKKKQGNRICTGAVSDILPYYKAADLAINPVISGSGSNLKMYAYLAGGLPVVTTRKGLRGVDAKPGKEVIVSDLRDFSKSIATLINDKRLQFELRKNSKKIARMYDWGGITRSSVKYYKQLLKNL